MEEAVCRLCLALLDPDDSGYSIANDRFRKALEHVFTFKINFEEDLPVYTCKQCSWNVLDFQSFSELVKTNQEKLRTTSQSNVQDKPFAGMGNTVPEKIVYGEDRSEKCVTHDFEAFNGSSADLECFSNNVKEVYNNHPDQVNVIESKSDQETSKLCPTLICEEYIITSNAIEKSDDYLTMAGAAVGNNVPSTNERLTIAFTNEDFSDVDEPSEKKQKILTNGALTNENKNSEPCERDSNDVLISSKVCLKNHKGSLGALSKQIDKMYPCEHCEKMFESKWLLEYHQQEHTVLKCMFCKQSVFLKHLNSHTATHLGDFKCNVCNGKFLSQRHLNYHKKTCTIKRQY